MAVGQIISRAIATGAIGADQIATGAITAADIPAGEITADKLHQTLDFSTKTFTMANAHVTQAMVTQHQSALSVTESQVSDLQSYVLPNTSPTFTNTTLTGYLAGPASFVIDPAGVGDNTGTVVIAGNLQVDGTQTTINSTTVSIDDLKLSVATDAANSAAANGAGITVGGANANITYTHATTSWDFDKPVNVTGAITATGISQFSDVNIPNNNAIRFGNSQDLQIYHDGFNNYINGQTGSIIIQNTLDDYNVIIKSDNGSGGMADYFRANGSTGAALMYHYGSEKLTTTSTGIDVTGNVTADGLTVDGAATFVGNSGANNLFIDGRSADNIGQVTFRSTNGATNYSQLQSRSTELKIKTLANIPMSFHTNNSPRITILNSGNVGIGEEVPLTALHVSSSSYPYVRITNDGYTGFDIGQADAGEGGAALVKLRDAADMDFYTADLNRMRISSTGNVGIGLITTDPSHKLHVSGDIKAEQYLLDEIAKDISDTAVDVFVYDTRKDSDGGAWRKRTQNTSWYNEAASSTRGARKEFPAVAVIVAESNQVTIYDGDDPDLPMWMVFNTGGNWSHILVSTSGYVRCVSMLNGHLVIGRNLNTGWMLTKTSFVDDSSYAYKNAAHGTSDGVWTGGIVARNGDGSYYDNGIASNIVSQYNNDVAMTVLPNALIDSATGLPVPTIAVATDSNVSIIRDNGTVVDITYANYNVAKNIYFNSKNHLIYSQNNTGTQRIAKVYYDIPSSDLNNPQGGYQRGAETVAYGDNGVSRDLSFSPAQLHIADISENSFGTSEKLILTDETNPPSSSMLNFIASDYATGWMNGDIKLATLSDTDDTNVTGSELVSNGLFSNGGDWSFGGGWNFANGQAEIDSNNNDLLSQNIGMVSGKTYTVTFYVTQYTDGYVSVRLGGTEIGTASATGFYAFTGVAAGSTLQIYGFTNPTLAVDDISVRLAEEDRSVNGKGLQVFGTVTKTAVATGADLVAYSGFSASNYLQQPVNTDIQNTNPRAFVCWVKSTQQASGYQYLWTLTNDSNYHYGLAIFEGTSGDGGKLYTYDQEHGLSVSSYMVADGSWHCVFFTDDEVDKKIYVDGNLVHTVNHGYDLNSANKQTMKLRIGTYNSGNNPMNIGSLSLLRVSGTIPSPEQIKKIYEDEKFLFQENAKATLYGSSDAVTALAYDDDTELLHVGGPNGRSVFQGLRRVDNTTDAVGAAISASNGMVAED